MASMALIIGWTGHRSHSVHGSGTNLKVGVGTRAARSALKKFLSCLPLFGSTDTTSRFEVCFRDGQYSLFSFLFAVLLLTVPPPPCPAIVKVG